MRIMHIIFNLMFNVLWNDRYRFNTTQWKVEYKPVLKEEIQDFIKEDEVLSQLLKITKRNTADLVRQSSNVTSEELRDHANRL